MNYDVIIVGAGPGGIFAAYELMQKKPSLKVAVFEAGHALSRRRCPIDGEKIKSCISCSSCSIMSVAGGLMLIYPGLVTDTVGLLLVAAVVAMQLIAGKKEKQIA